MYLLRDDGDYHYAMEIPEGAKYPEGDQYQLVDEIEGHALEDRIAVDFDQTDEIETDDEGKQHRKFKPVLLGKMLPERKEQMARERAHGKELERKRAEKKATQQARQPRNS